VAGLRVWRYSGVVGSFSIFLSLVEGDEYSNAEVSDVINRSECQAAGLASQMVTARKLTETWI
jgi:hypothetical protein